MLKSSSKEFRKFFLLQFTAELIRHKRGNEWIILKEIAKKNKQEIQEERKDLIKQIERRKDFQKVVNTRIPVQRKIIPSLPPVSRVLTIPKPRLPSTLNYLKPSPSSNIEIDLGKLNPLVKDPMVKSIECSGADQSIFVKGSMGTKKTKIVLSKEEIDEVIKKFSEKSRIPVEEGVYRVVVGRLILTAIVSDVISSKFIINKMLVAPSEGRRNFGR